MTEYTLAVKAGAGATWGHDPSAALFADGDLVFGAEEERFNREKHGAEAFPAGAVTAALDRAGVDLPAVDTVVATAEPALTWKRLPAMVEHELQNEDRRLLGRLYGLKERIESMASLRWRQSSHVRHQLSALDRGTLATEVVTRAHHRCHAASAFYPTTFDRALVVTLDGRGEYDATVVWRGTPDGLERVRTYEYPNSLGNFFAVVTQFLGFRPNNGEGKVMGLAPYGDPNPEIANALRELVTPGVDYDTTPLTTGSHWVGVQRLETALGRSHHEGDADTFAQWERDLAFEAQRLLEAVVLDVVVGYADRLDTATVCLAGGVALNCKLNKRVRESPAVDDLFVQPVSHDGGLVLGAGMLESTPAATTPWNGGSAYLGPDYDAADVAATFDANKLDYERPDDLAGTVAAALADGQLVGWFQGRTEMGPRALGNRSILADPRTAASRDRVNEHVKHREEWRPFAPSILAEAADDYLVDAVDAPYMVQTFDVPDERRTAVEAVVHPGDGTTRPQTVTPDANPRYHRLISAFADRTGVPVLLNTSFNDHGEPIVNTPTEAVVDFYRMGLDLLVVEDLLLRK